MSRQCSRCGEMKDEFPNKKTYCRQCGNEMCRDYKRRNKDKIAEYNKTYKNLCNVLDCIRYAIENGCPYDTEDEYVMLHINQLKRNIETTKNIIKNVELNDNVVNHIINKYI